MSKAVANQRFWADHWLLGVFRLQEMRRATADVSTAVVGYGRRPPLNMYELKLVPFTPL
ncbi:MAG TPA: hypothetical protein VKB47_17265 [Terracidiphilus sp.]|nr:hypothetical protein [Terracidiphilus sp.]